MLRVVVRDRSYQSAEVCRASDRAALELALHQAALPVHPLGRRWTGARLERECGAYWKKLANGSDVEFIKQWLKLQKSLVGAA